MGLTSWFRPKPKGLVGIDIGSSAVKVVALKRRGHSFQLEAIGKNNLPEDTIVDGAIISKLPLAENIEQILSEEKIQENKVATSISGHSVIVKKVTLPALTEDELDESIQWEAEQYIPFDLGEVNVDYQIIRRVPDEEKLEVILVAAKKDKIADYTSVVAMAGKNALVVDIDAFALQNAYEVNYQPDSEEVVGLLNIGASSMTINIVRGTEFLFTRDITTGGNQYTDFLQRELGATFEEAEQCKLEGGSVEVTGDQVASVLHSVSENLALEIEKTFDYFKTTTYSDNVSKLYVSGGASKTEGLKDYLAETFQFPVEYLNPFRRINPGVTGGMLDESEHSGVEFAISVGLALRTV